MELHYVIPARRMKTCIWIVSAWSYNCFILRHLARMILHTEYIWLCSSKTLWPRFNVDFKMPQVILWFFRNVVLNVRPVGAGQVYVQLILLRTSMPVFGCHTETWTWRRNPPGSSFNNPTPLSPESSVLHVSNFSTSPSSSLGDIVSEILTIEQVWSLLLYRPKPEQKCTTWTKQCCYLL